MKNLRFVAVFILSFTVFAESQNYIEFQNNRLLIDGKSIDFSSPSSLKASFQGKDVQNIESYLAESYYLYDEGLSFLYDLFSNKCIQITVNFDRAKSYSVLIAEGMKLQNKEKIDSVILKIKQMGIEYKIRNINKNKLNISLMTNESRVSTLIFENDVLITVYIHT